MFKLGLKGIVIIIITLLVIGGIVGGIFGYRYYMANIKGEVEKSEQVQSGDFKIFSYDYFYNKIAAIQSTEAQYDIQYDLLQGLTEGTEEYTTQLYNVSAIKATVIRLKNEYNADVDKEGTRGQFKANELPTYINPVCVYGERTTY